MGARVVEEARRRGLADHRGPFAVDPLRALALRALPRPDGYRVSPPRALQPLRGNPVFDVSLALSLARKPRGNAQAIQSREGHLLGARGRAHAQGFSALDPDRRL